MIGLDWIGAVFVLGQVGLMTAAIPKWMPLACGLGCIGDIFLSAFFVIHFNLPLLLLNLIFGVLSLVGVFQWKKKLKKT